MSRVARLNLREKIDFGGRWSENSEVGGRGMDTGGENESVYRHCLLVVGRVVGVIRAIKLGVMRLGDSFRFNSFMHHSSTVSWCRFSCIVGNDVSIESRCGRC